MDLKALKVTFDKEERNEILAQIDECLVNGQLSQGKYVTAFEELVAEYVHVKHAIAVSSGTSAIEVVMRNLNIKGKEVLIPTNTFLATAMGVYIAGGIPKLVDIDSETLAIDFDDIKRNYTENTAGVIIVHIGGIIPPNIEKIKAWCDEKKIWMFEDAAHAHGSKYHDKYAGTFGIAGAYSFFATKVITSGEGGVVFTDDDQLAEQIRLYRNHGKKENWITYNTQLGVNLRMSEITGVIAYNEMKRLDQKIGERAKIANLYIQYINEKMPNLQMILPQDRCSWYKFVVLLPEKCNRDVVKEELKNKGISLQGEVYATPLHRQPIADEFAHTCSYPNADDICKRHICLPIYVGLSPADVERVVDELKETIEKIMK